MRTKRIPWQGKPLQATAYAAITTDGGRFGLITCLDCGALVMIGDPEADSVALHEQWHERQEMR